MSAFYLELEPIQEPFDLGKPDANGRAQYAMNVRAVKAYSTDFGLELCKLLVDHALGVAGSTLFLGSFAELPEDPTISFLVVRETGGMAPDRSHNSVTTPNHQRPSAHIVAHGATADAARALIWGVYAAVVDVRNTTLSST